jgi:acid phosphatase type 7
VAGTTALALAGRLVLDTPKRLDSRTVKLMQRLLTTLALAFIALTLAPASAQAADPMIAAAGDIACDPSDSSFFFGLGDTTRCRQRYTSDLLVGAGYAAVLPLGDNQYNSGSLSDYQASYDPSWGRVKSITRPVPGNHEPGSASGYFDYFNGSGKASGPAGERGKGYYSFDVGAWHLIAINSNCSRVPCGSGSAQEQWLRADLAAHPNACALAYWHHPRFSSGHDGNNVSMQAIWQDLYNAGVEIVISGHSHNYERFAPQNGSSKLDRGGGVRQFVVGTGGAFFTGLSSAKPNSEVRQNNTYGVLRLTLGASSYSWKFVPEAGKSFTDSGTGSCHGPNVITAPPTVLPSPGNPGPAVITVNPSSGTESAQGVRCTVAGTARSDVIKGSSRNDVICGLGGDDTIRGGDGKDLIFGGNGKDRLAGGRGGDVLYGHRQSDVIRGQSGNDRLVGGGGRDRIYGNVGSDRLLSSGDRRGGDRVSGGRGRDRAWVNRADDILSVERLFRRRR